MRKYDDPVEVRRGDVDQPTQFLWHGRLWKVREVSRHWVETGAWWQSGAAHRVLGSDESGSDLVGPDLVGPDLVGPDLLAEQERWRVEAGWSGRQGQVVGTFDLAYDWADGSWRLVGCQD